MRSSVYFVGTRGSLFPTHPLNLHLLASTHTIITSAQLAHTCGFCVQNDSGQSMYEYRVRRNQTHTKLGCRRLDAAHLLRVLRSTASTLSAKPSMRGTSRDAHAPSARTACNSRASSRRARRRGPPTGSQPEGPRRCRAAPWTHTAPGSAPGRAGEGSGCGASCSCQWQHPERGSPLRERRGASRRNSPRCTATTGWWCCCRQSSSGAAESSLRVRRRAP
eukprot:COSAG04_NODE_10435_length_777_cov_1.578171_1_plen_219_part_10